MEQKVYKRKTREMSDITKQKISQKLKGRTKSAQHCERISQGLKNAWATIEPKVKTENDSNSGDGF